MHGFGVYCFANGHRYEGAWHGGRRQGFGLYTFRNGDTQSGHWENGVLGVSTSQNAFLPESSSTSVSHAKVLKAAVQVLKYTILTTSYLNWLVMHVFYLVCLNS